MRMDAGYRPMTAPISASMTSERRCSAAAGIASAARKRSGSAMRHVTRLSTPRFFLSIVRNSEGAGRKNRMRLSSRTTRSNGAVPCRPGSATTRTTRPNRVTIPYSVTSRAKNDETTAQIASTAVNAGSVRRRMTLDRLFAAKDCSAILTCHGLGHLAPTDPAAFLLLALIRTDRLQQPNVDVFHLTGTGPHKLPHTGQNVFERFKLQSEFCQRRGTLVSFEPKREGVRAGLRASDALLLESQRRLGHRRGLALCLVDLLHCKDVRQVDRAQLVLLGACDVSEGIMDLIRRVVIE